MTDVQDRLRRMVVNRRLRKFVIGTIVGLIVLAVFALVFGAAYALGATAAFGRFPGLDCLGA